MADTASFCAKHNIVVQNGDSSTSPAEDFKSTDFSDALQRKLLHRGYTAPTAIQAMCWPIACSGRDIIAISVTGSGKTLAYLLPAMFHISTAAVEVGDEGAAPSALVLAPTRELAQQIHAEAERYSSGELWWNNGTLRCVYCCGGLEMEPQMQALARGAELVVATPGRLLYFAARGAIDLGQVTFFVLDEADRLLDMGFSPQVDDVAAELQKSRQTLLLSATWSPELQGLAELLQQSPVHLDVGQDQGAEATACVDIVQHVHVLKDHEKLPKLLEVLKDAGFLDPNGCSTKVIIFSNTKKGCDELVKNLVWHGVPNADAIHANRTQADREMALAKFTKGSCRCLVATDVAARGIDVKDISLVVNWDFPDTLGAVGVEDYVHRIGRTARAGAQGTAVTFFPHAPSDKHPANAHHLVRFLRAAGMEVSSALERLDRGEVVSARQQRKANSGPQTAVPAARSVQGTAKQRARAFDLVKELQRAGDQRDALAAKQTWHKFELEGIPHTVYSFAAGVKACVSCGDVKEAAKQMEQMSKAKVAPNVVVFTTLIKGYCAVGDIESADAVIQKMEAAHVAPDVRTINTFLRGCIRVGNAQAGLGLFNQMEHRWELVPDATSYKYVSRMLSQTLQYSVLKQMLHDLRAREKAGDRAAASILNSLGNRMSMHLDLASAAILLGKFPAAHSNLKRAALGDQNDRKESLFDETRLNELRRESEQMDRFLGSDTEPPDLPQRLSRALIFSSRLDLEETLEAPSKDELADSLFSAVEQTLGGSACDLTELRDCIKRYLGKSCHLRWDRIFGVKRKRDITNRCPVMVEVCSGSGDWVVAQAKASEGTANWVSVELRHDRVCSVWKKMIFEHVSNLLVIGGDAARVLKTHVKPETVERVCINFPEPPHWTGNTDAASELHLLTASFFRNVYDVLSEFGGMTILSDNYQYCQSLAKEISELSKEGRSMFQSADAKVKGGDTTHDYVGNIRIFHGLPRKDSGHAVNETSQFDGFWERGQYIERYFIAVNKI